MKFGPFSLRSFPSHRKNAPTRQVVGPHQLWSADFRLIFQHFIMICHCSGVMSRFCATPCLVRQPRIVQRRKDGRYEKRKQAAPLHLVQQIERRDAVRIRLAGIPDHERHYREPVIAVEDGKALDEHARPLVDGKGHALARHDLLRHPGGPRLHADQRRQNAPLGVSAERGQLDGTLVQHQVRQPLDQPGIHHRRGHRAMAQQVMLHPGSAEHPAEQIEKRLAVGEIERRVRVHLSPDEHVLGCERDLVVAVAARWRAPPP